jgi:uncharacterized protein YecE (DUF72 family)
MPCPIYIGIAGWSYQDWNGIVYPRTGMDTLAYVSRFVDCIEINSTFYRPPSARNSDSWFKRTRALDRFFFTAKLHREITHESRLEPEMIQQFREGLAPLREAGRLRYLLAQFRYDVADTPGTRERLQRIVGALGETFDLVLELRHRSWEDPAALTFLQSLGVGLCSLDYPVSSNSFQLDTALSGVGYLRLHGRNHAAWFSKAGRDETYNYYYNRDELEQIRQRLRKLADACLSVVVIGNNHYRGSELANAIELKHLLTGEKQPVPDGLLRAYPHLHTIATAGEGLFGS